MTRKTWAAGLLALLTVFCAVMLALHWRDDGAVTYYENNLKPAAAAPAIVWPAGPVNVNTATEAQLNAWHGLNSAQVEALIQDRSRNGDFHFPEDLLYVKGIGEKTLAKIYDQLDFSRHAGGD